MVAGVPKPRWADGQLAELVRVGDCLRLYDIHETTSVLVASFRRVRGWQSCRRHGGRPVPGGVDTPT